MKEVAVLASGGLDSTALMVHYLEKGYHVTPIFCAYGQKMLQHEWDALTHIRKVLSVLYPYHVESIYRIELGTLGRSRLLDTETISRCDSFRYPGVHEAYVPGRDVLMLLHAASFLEHRGCSMIAMGTHKTDTLNGFPDCNPKIAEKVQDLLNCSTSRTDWIIATPFINMTKAEIASSITGTRIDLYKMVFSGYGNALEY
jgi:7-cyano-7-deazaguanine synthase in queuosine biosynthesis